MRSWANRNWCSTLITVPSPWCDVTGHRGFSNQDRLLHTYFSLSISPSVPTTFSCLSALRHGDVSRSDWSFPLLLKSHDLYNQSSLRKGFRIATRLVEFRRENRSSSARDYYATFSMTSYNRCTKGFTTNLYGRTDNMGCLSCVVYLTITAFWRRSFAASLRMAVSTRVESSSILPTYNLLDVTIPKIPHFI